MGSVGINFGKPWVSVRRFFQIFFYKFLFFFFNYRPKFKISFLLPLGRGGRFETRKPSSGTPPFLRAYTIKSFKYLLYTNNKKIFLKIYLFIHNGNDFNYIIFDGFKYIYFVWLRIWRHPYPYFMVLLLAIVGSSSVIKINRRV